MKLKIFIFMIILSTLIYLSCGKSSKSGEWSGEGISFTVNKTGDSIIKLEVVIPNGKESLVQWYSDLAIENNKFESYQSGNSFIGLPERDLKGEFLSNTLAKGSMNGIAWEAKPKK